MVRKNKKKKKLQSFKLNFLVFRNSERGNSVCVSVRVLQRGHGGDGHEHVQVRHSPNAVFDDGNGDHSFA